MMKRKNPSFLVLFIFLISFFQIDMASSKSIEAQFIGNEAFRITDGNFTLVTDFPYESGIYGYMEYNFNFAGTVKNVLALITHRHLDHFAPLLFTEQNWKIIGPKEVTQQLERNKVIKMAKVMTYGPINVTPRKTTHANTEHYSYLVKWHGKSLFFTGDTEDMETLKALPVLDALFITPWFYRKAKMNDMLPDAKKIIIYHHQENDIVPDCRGCIIPLQDEIISLQ